MNRILVFLSWSWLALAPSAPGHASVVGEWAGWLDMDDGDVPVRLHVGEEDGALVTVIDLPAAGQIGVRLGSTLVSGGSWTIAHPSAEDPRVRLSIEPAADGTDGRHRRGAVEWFGVAGRVDLHRAEGPLHWEPPAVAREVVGLYGDDDGGRRIVRATSWGELVLVDPEVGLERGLFPRAEGEYRIGPARYVPAPVERTARAERDDEGDVVAWVETEGGVSRRFPRLELLEDEVVVERDGVELVGSLVHPGPPGAPVAVVAGGSDWTDRDRVRDVSLLLASFGVASVIHDKRGHGESGGEETVPFREIAADLRAFADAARGLDAVAGGRVGYLGLSRGGWYGPLAAAGDPEAAFFVDVVGPAVSPIEQETTARLDRMREGGASAEAIALGERYLDAMWTFTRTRKDGDALLALRAEVEEAGWLGVLLGPPDLDDASWEWMRLNGDFDPKSTLRALRCPTLALFGEEDLAVAARTNAPAMRAALRDSAADPARVEVLPNADHGLRIVRRDATGARLPYHRGVGYHPEAWRTIASFIRSN
ncbi:MAG: alpha/beta hydrolase family protein [Planctomycetota bacterium JB042]